jgi:hypothetical protein
MKASLVVSTKCDETRIGKHNDVLVKRIEVELIGRFTVALKRVPRGIPQSIDPNRFLRRG